MCEMIVKQLYTYIYIYFCERGPLDSFVPNFVFFYDTFVRLRMNPEKSRCKMMSFYSHFVNKSGLNCKVYPQNVNQVLQM